MGYVDRSREGWLWGAGHRAGSRERAAFTLVELLVALVLLDIGIIALSTASAAVSRVHAGATSDRRAQELASTRIERMLSSRCGGPATGTGRLGRDAEEWWSDAPAPNGVRWVSESLVVTIPHGRRIVALHGAGRC